RNPGVEGPVEGPGAQTQALLPITRLFVTGSAPATARKLGSTLHGAVPSPLPGVAADVSLHGPLDALVFQRRCGTMGTPTMTRRAKALDDWSAMYKVSEAPGRSEEHTSELQSRVDLVCRLLLE